MTEVKGNPELRAALQSIFQGDLPKLSECAKRTHCARWHPPERWELYLKKEFRTRDPWECDPRLKGLKGDALNKMRDSIDWSGERRAAIAAGHYEPRPCGCCDPALEIHTSLCNNWSPGSRLTPRCKCR